MPYKGQAMGEELDLMVLISGMKQHQSAPSNPALYLLPALHKTTKNIQPLHIH
jgi:hypothetical protein